MHEGDAGAEMPTAITKYDISSCATISEHYLFLPILESQPLIGGMHSQEWMTLMRKVGPLIRPVTVVLQQLHSFSFVNLNINR